MNEKEIAELRRRFRAEKSGIARIRGCFVNEAGRSSPGSTSPWG